jgi:hypothetical protein
MNRKAYFSTLSAALICLSAGLLTGCGGGSNNSGTTPPNNTPSAVAATTGSAQSIVVGGTYTALAATVTNSGGTGVSGVSVTFTVMPGSSGATASFATGGTTDTETTSSSGVATTSQTLTAGTTAGAFTIAATVSGVSTPATFAETNTASVAANLAATSGGGQSTAVSTAFTNPLVATVTDADGNPVSGVSVTFTAPASGASGTFATATPGTTDTETTGSNGQATSQAFSANSIAGGPYNVVASATGLTSVNFAETNAPVVTVTANTYVFYASGEEFINGGVGAPNYYAVAGAVSIDANGDVLGGEQDYNDAFGFTSPNEPTPDTISATTGALVAVDASTGLYTLTLTTSNPNTGTVNTGAGVEEFLVQFVNPSHALIMQFDGSATSSGSLDLQTLASTNGNFAFAITGVNPSYESVAFGGVYTANGTSITGTLDVNDADGGPSLGNSFTATAGTTDSFGRTVTTGITNPSYAAYSLSPAPITFASYEVTAEVLRIIDVDNGTTTGATADAAIGSAYGQGTNATAASSASLGASVFNLLGQWTQNYATLGEFTTSSTTSTTGAIAGTADDNELETPVQQEALPIAGNYSIASNGYGSITGLTWTIPVTTPPPPSPNVTTLGLYLVDPTLNINDPNNTTSADVGGGLIIDLDSALPGGSGVIIPQTDTTVADFNGTYVAGFQDFNISFDSNCYSCEFDMLSQGTMATGAALSLTGADSDPFGTVSGTPAESTGDSFTSTPLAVPTGIYSMSQFNPTPNPLSGTINTQPGTLDVDIYQASGTTLYWLNWDGVSVFLGPIVAQASDLTGIPGAKKPAGKTQPTRNQNSQPTKGFGGGTLR